MLAPFPEDLFSLLASHFSSDGLPFDHFTVQQQFLKRMELLKAGAGIIWVLTSPSSPALLLRPSRMCLLPRRRNISPWQVPGPAAGVLVAQKEIDIGDE